MKLTSFVVRFPFLAITVSAYPPQSTSTQDMQLYQSTSTQTPQQSYQDRVQAEILRLTTVYEEKENLFTQVDSDSQIGRYQVLQLEDMVDEFHIELKRIDLSSDEASELKQKYHDARMQLDELMPEYKKQQQLYTQAMGVRNDAKAELKLLENNCKLMEEYSFKYGVQVGPSPNFLYNLEILKKQSDDILREIDLSLAKYDRVKTDEKTYGARLFSARSDKLQDVIRVLQSQSRVAENIFAAAQIDSVDR
ncbi:hypothetical protein BASA81_014463 [Batrachochytrium salamandrivorans]|nr:hypothetical protein BASA81_014463 [Batrachochytrium salamandrivorans]